MRVAFTQSRAHREPAAWRTFALGFFVGVLALATPTEARAYILDANDAVTLAPGGFEFEFQPVGWYQTFGPEGERYLVAPSLMLYAGLAPRWDLLLIARGYAGIDGGDQTRYSVADDGIFTRVLLRDGTYTSDEEVRGPSLALQLGVLLPTYRDEGGAGASAALLLSQDWSERLILHANAQLDRRLSGDAGFFATLAVEAPLGCPLHAVAETYLDIEGGSLELSTLGGLNYAHPSDRWTLGAAGRYFDIDGEAGVEARLSFWVAVSDP